MKNKELVEQGLNNRFLNEKIKIIEWNGSVNPVVFKCLKCNKQFELCQGYLLTRKNRTHLCNECHKNIEEITLNIKNKIDEALNKNESLEVVTPFELISKTMEFKCKKCDSVFKRMSQIFLKNQECPICNCVAVKKTDSYFKEQVSKMFNNEYEILQKYEDAYSKVLVKHNCGFVYKTTPHNLLNGKGCPKCNRFHSKGEKRIEKILKKYSIDYEAQKSFDDGSVRMLKFDFYLPQKNIAIEYQGEQHYEKVDFFGGEEKFKKQINNDNKKRKYCKDNNIKLIEIKYTDFDDIEKIISSL